MCSPVSTFNSESMASILETEVEAESSYSESTESDKDSKEYGMLEKKVRYVRMYCTYVLYICMYVRTYVLYVCMCVRTYVLYVCMYVRTYVLYVCMCVRMYCIYA